VTGSLDELGHLALVLGTQSRLDPVHRLARGRDVPPQQGEIVVVEEVPGNWLGLAAIHQEGGILMFHEDMNQI